MEAIDRVALDAQTGGDAALAREVLGLFAGQCRLILPQIADPGLPRARRADLAHTLKGSAAGVGAHRVHALCAAAEARLLRAGPDDGQETGHGAGDAAALAALAEAVADALALIAAEAAGAPS